jgi:hypothetical protein
VTAAARAALLGAWAGLLAAWGLVFVPALFGHLPATGTVAILVGVTLARIDAAGLVLGTTSVALGLASRPRSAARRALAWAPLVGVACHAASLFWLSPEIRAIRESAGGSVGTLAADDPRIPAFRTLHTLAFGAFGLAAACAVGALAADLLVLRKAAARGAYKSGNP